MSTSLPVVIVGAGPVGLAAAVHTLLRGFTPLILESGAAVGAAMRQWGHVRMFSPWAFNIDTLSAERLSAHGWIAPDPTHFPTGSEVVAQYLEPLAALPELASRIHLNVEVVAVTKQRRDLMKNMQRDTTPYVVRFVQDGEEHEVLAQAVIDASGTTTRPNPLGAAGIPALGERAAAHHVAYGLADMLGSERARYNGRRVLVVGSGHSAFNVLSDLVRLRDESGAGEIHWAVRRPSLARVLGGGENDQLVERGRLGVRMAQMVEQGLVQLHVGIHVDRIERTGDGLVAWSGDTALPAVDEIVGATGFRPDLTILDEVRLDLDAGTQSPSALAPLIDPNLHSCGSVRPHGAVELQHPDRNFYIVGMKSYGRAPTFLLLTGYEQVRSVTAAIAGDWDAAQRIELVLPETGVCSTQFGDEENAADTATAGCCGGPAPAAANACCVADAEAKAEGAAGCGCCSSPTIAVAAPVVAVATAKASTCCSRAA
jgi:hypothetical protein